MTLLALVVLVVLLGLAVWGMDLILQASDAGSPATGKAHRAMVEEVRAKWLAGGITQRELAEQYGKHPVHPDRPLAQGGQNRSLRTTEGQLVMTVTLLLIAVGFGLVLAVGVYGMALAMSASADARPSATTNANRFPRLVATASGSSRDRRREVS